MLPEAGVKSVYIKHNGNAFSVEIVGLDGVVHVASKPTFGDALAYMLNKLTEARRATAN